MNLYLISQDVNNDYDTYDSAVVAASNEEDARNIHPSPFVAHVSDGKWMGTYSGGVNIGKEYESGMDDWIRYEYINLISVEFLGKTEKPRGVILASFNAG